MRIEGELVAHVDLDAGRVRHAAAFSRRPRVARVMLPGRSPGEAVSLVGTLFAICGRSQGVAAASALDAACSRSVSTGLEAARNRRIAAETALEHFWRVLIDWPSAASLDPEPATIAQLRTELAPWLAAREEETAAPVAGIARIARERVFGMDANSWLAIGSVGELLEWSRSAATPAARAAQAMLGDEAALGASDVGLLDPVDESVLAVVLEPGLATHDDFEERPHWRGEARETGALARVRSHPLVAGAMTQWGRGVGTRAVARLVELALLVDAIGGNAGAPRRHGAHRVSDDTAMSWVETARGLLVHRARVEDGRIADYRIVAPTEWNFHPRGAFVRGALALRTGKREAVRRDASRIVASLDPCVAWRVEVGHA
jgi:Ni,Fe-hydrogenase I large subunit